MCALWRWDAEALLSTRVLGWDQSMYKDGTISELESDSAESSLATCWEVSIFRRFLHSHNSTNRTVKHKVLYASSIVNGAGFTDWVCLCSSAENREQLQVSMISLTLSSYLLVDFFVFGFLYWKLRAPQTTSRIMKITNYRLLSTQYRQTHVHTSHWWFLPLIFASNKPYLQKTQMCIVSNSRCDLSRSRCVHVCLI